ncbi:Protein of unknown function [Pyronema omphalodes CBS 100304]|uniref:Uncharacterized protein n=1 Tax=Pyronema omphalodes (strain CBS 100304) TaxID=1076935 RepID=U4LYN3_PYROM|nr:Protein of unknown function [Pyronema omphalodes CBS 100304]
MTHSHQLIQTSLNPMPMTRKQPHLVSHDRLLMGAMFVASAGGWIGNVLTGLG